MQKTSPIERSETGPSIRPRVFQVWDKKMSMPEYFHGSAPQSTTFFLAKTAQVFTSEAQTLRLDDIKGIGNRSSIFQCTYCIIWLNIANLFHMPLGTERCEKNKCSWHRCTFYLPWSFKDILTAELLPTCPEAIWATALHHLSGISCRALCVHHVLRCENSLSLSTSRFIK